MNIYVSVDMEGITGIVHGDMMSAEGREYDRGRKLMTGDANAAVEGLQRGGAQFILVSDGHGPMRNIFFEDLHAAAHLMTGSSNARDYCQLEGADVRRFDAAVFIGYHAMAKASKAIHPHTVAGAAVAELRINGRPHGETGLNAAILGSLGVPVVMVAGDTTTCTEAKAFLGNEIETVAVKEAVGRTAAICRPPAATRADISSAAERALRKMHVARVYDPGQPFRFEVDFVTMMQCDRAARTPQVERLSPMTIGVQGATPWEQYRTFWAALRAALTEPASWLA